MDQFNLLTVRPAKARPTAVHEVQDNYAPCVVVPQKYSLTIVENSAMLARDGHLTELIERRSKHSKAKQVYYKTVWEETEKHTAQLDGIENRGWEDYHVDHIVPIQFGFRKKLPPALVGSLENLRMLSWEDNMAKSSKLTDESKRLLKKWGIKY